jgi:hypothetical protein
MVWEDRRVRTRRVEVPEPIPARLLGKSPGSLLIARRESHLLIAKTPTGWAQIVSVHRSFSTRL